MEKSVFAVDKNPTRMNIFEHIGIKMLINVISTSAMALFGRINVPGANENSASGKKVKRR